MSKVIVYSCVFFNEKYVNLINLLLKSYKLFGNSSDDVDYLIICNPDYQKKIQELFDNLDINGKIWCLDLKTMFEAGYSRLKIFNYPDINLYNKILYLDCDILVTNSINNILDFQLENKLYALQEGNTNHHYWGKQFFGKNNPNCEAFTSGILLFNNNIIIKDLFSQILLHINNHITSKLSIPGCLDQPFIVYHAVKNNLYDNQKLINIVINNPNVSDLWRPKQIHQNYNGQTICHFPGGPGLYENKIEKMSNFMNDIMFNFNKNNLFKIKIDNYEKILDNNKKHFDKLYTICKETKEKVEGNCFTQHLNIDNKINELIYKQLNHFSLGFNATNIMEIGFNAGHSSLLYLLANPNSTLTIFDICEHKYTLPCFKYLQSVFPDRLQIFPGDSTKTVSEFYINNPNTKFDLIHIDGAHFGDIPNKDFYNSLKLSSDIIIWDDTQILNLNEMLNKYIKKGLVNEVFLYETKVYKHRVCRINLLLNKKYKWGDSSITFLENGKMNAFGMGKYNFIDKYLVNCHFGGNEHLLKFNEDYSRFISVRKGDFKLLIGNHL
jgi:lipopolysaccharide biosynthesis glycosyltransferase